MSNRMIEQQIEFAQQLAEACRRPACVDARAQADRVPGLLEKLVRKREDLADALDSIRNLESMKLSPEVEHKEKLHALEAAQASLRAEQRREIEGYRAQLRDLRDAQHHAEHRAAGAESARDLGREREMVLQARISVLEAQLRQAVGDNSRMRDRIDDLRHDLQQLLQKSGGSGEPTPLSSSRPGAADATPAPRYPAVRAAVRRQAEINGAIRRAFSLPGRAA